MSARFQMTPERLRRWQALQADGLRQDEIAAALGCSVITLVRHKRRTGAIDEKKQRAGRASAAVRYASNAGA